MMQLLSAFVHSNFWTWLHVDTAFSLSIRISPAIVMEAMYAGLIDPPAIQDMIVQGG